MKKIRLIVLVTLLTVVGCSHSKMETGIKQISVYEFSEFGHQGTELLGKVDSESGKNIFKKMLKHQKLADGIMDVGKGDYTIEFQFDDGEKQHYHLWLSGGNGMYTSIEDTGQGYTINAEVTESLKTILVYANNKPFKNSQGTERITEVEQNDFRLKFVSAQDQYKVGQKVQLTASLEYIGEKEEIEIFHAMSPFIFEVKERTRNIKIPYPMEQPLVTTRLVKNEAYLQTYQKSAGYGSHDPNKAFIKEFLEEEGFPKGEYTITLVSDFWTANENDEKIGREIRIPLVITVY